MPNKHKKVINTFGLRSRGDFISSLDIMMQPCVIPPMIQMTLQVNHASLIAMKLLPNIYFIYLKSFLPADTLPAKCAGPWDFWTDARSIMPLIGMSHPIIPETITNTSQLLDQIEKL